MTEEIKNAVLHEMCEYCKENITDFDLRSELAVRNMERDRAPLYHVDPSLSEEINDAVDQWLFDNFDNDDIILCC